MGPIVDKKTWLKKLAERDALMIELNNDKDVGKNLFKIMQLEKTYLFWRVESDMIMNNEIINKDKMYSEYQSIMSNIKTYADCFK
jgi:hypothetical protein